MKKDANTALVLCVLFGYFGVHKFYEGKIGLGILYLLTFGLFGIGWIIDIALLAIKSEEHTKEIQILYKQKEPHSIRKITREEFEQFMIACNAQIEHDEEMKQYERKPITINQKSNENSEQKAESFNIQQFAAECNRYVRQSEREETNKD